VAFQTEGTAGGLAAGSLSGFMVVRDAMASSHGAFWAQTPGRHGRFRVAAARSPGAGRLASRKRCLQWHLHASGNDSLTMPVRSWGVQLIGDLPFYVAMTVRCLGECSSCFRCGSDGSVSPKAGCCHPGLLSDRRQLWGTPVYSLVGGIGWAAFAGWRRRLRAKRRLIWLAPRPLPRLEGPMGRARRRGPRPQAGSGDVLPGHCPVGSLLGLAGPLAA